MEQKEEALRAELKELEQKLQDPAIYSDKNYPKLAKRKAELDDLISLFDEKTSLAKQLSEASDLANDSDPAMAAMGREELEDLDQKITANQETLVEALTPTDPNNDRDVIIEIRAA